MMSRTTLGKVLLMLITIYFSCNSFILAIKYAGYATYLMVFVVFAVGAISILKGKYRISQNAIFLMILCSFNIVITIVANGFTSAYILLILNFILSASYIRLYSRQEFYESYIVVMKILAIFAIMFGLINISIPSLLSGFSVYAHNAGSYYRDMIITFQSVDSFRINSIWGEPGMFSVFLIFALIFEVFYVKRKISMKNYIIFIIALVLTFSTNGLICLGVILVALILNQKGRGKSGKIFLISFILALVVIYAMNNIEWFSEQINASTSKLDQNDISFIGRFAPILNNLIQGIKSPFWGHGLSGGRFYVDFPFYTGYLYCNTSTTTFLFFAFGFIFPIITMYLMWKLVVSNRLIQNVIVKVLLFSVIVININTQAVHLDQIYYLILFSVYMCDDSCMKYKYEKSGVMK